MFCPLTILTMKEPLKERKPEHTVYGISLGRSYARIACIDQFGTPCEIPFDYMDFGALPTVVFIESPDTYTVGDVAKEIMLTDPELVCSNILRLLSDPDSSVKLHDMDFSPELLAAMVVSKLTQLASYAVEDKVRNVIIGCPYYFGQHGRDAIKDACLIAGMETVRVVPEPLLAAMAYIKDFDKPQTVIVYDLGGFTFDVTIIKFDGNSATIVDCGGDHLLGGKDWDDKILLYAANILAGYSGKSGHEVFDEIFDDHYFCNDLLLKTETAKNRLSVRDKTNFRFEGHTIELTRGQFEQITSELLDRTVGLTRNVMERALEKGVSGFDRIVLSGAATQMPQVLAGLKKEFPNIPVEMDCPASAVARGAALYGRSPIVLTNEDIHFFREFMDDVIYSKQKPESIKDTIMDDNIMDPDDVIIEAPTETPKPKTQETAEPVPAGNGIKELEEPLYTLASDSEIEEIQKMVESEPAPLPDASTPEADSAETEATEQPVSAVIPASVKDLAGIKDKLDELTRIFERKIENDTHKAALFDKMYDELQSYKADIYAKILKPFVLSTITLIDDTNAFLGKLEENDSRKAEKYLRGIPDDLLDILELNGVETYEEEGETFNPRTQKAMKSVVTDNPDLNKHIAKRLRPGYRWNGSILKPELVQIYKYEVK